MSTPNHKTRRLSVLLITPEVSRRSDLMIVGEARPSVSDPAHVDFAELLSACNYTFDIVAPEDIAPELFGDSGSVKYSSVVLAVPMRGLSDAALSVVRQVSYELGISLVAAYDCPDNRSAAWFGIERFNGKRMLWPLKAKIIRWPNADGTACVADYGLASGFAGVRRRGLRKLSLKQTLTKGMSLISSLKMPYKRTARAPKTRILSTTMRGEPLAWSYEFGDATNYYFALHGDFFLDKYNEMHRLVRSAINANSGHGMVCADLDQTMVWRLDDPGASKAEYLDDGCLLTEKEWRELGILLEEERTPLSVMYTPGWVDDGNHRSGEVFIDDKLLTERTPGAVRDSARVKYVFSDRHKPPHDHVSEFCGLETLVKKGVVDVHSHGLTHLTPDRERWAAAADKGTDTRWYTEFYCTREDRAVSAEDQTAAMTKSKDKIENLFGTPVAVLTPSSHRHDHGSDALAQAAGYKLFSADYTGIIKGDVLVRNWKIPALMIYFKEPSTSIVKAGYPLLGVVHDYEVKTSLEQFRRVLRRWMAAGIKRCVSLNSLAASLCSQIDASYSAKDAKMEVRITLPAATRPSRLPMPRVAADILIKIVVPPGYSYTGESIDVSGGNLVSMEKPAQNTINMSVRAADAKSVRIVIPVRQSQSNMVSSSDGRNRDLLILR